MMAVQMDNTSALSSRERAQCLYNKNVELETSLRKASQARRPSDPNVWQQMRENYEAIILEDHEFAEKHEIECALWLLHYKRIEELRVHFNAALASSGSPAAQPAAQSGKGGHVHPDRLAKIRSHFKTFLSEATGFYHELMLKIRAKYGLPLGYSNDPEQQICLSKDGDKSNELKKGLVSCQRCLIYLGDLARYKGQYGEGESRMRDFGAASSYYMQASSLWPSSGNPHHQLAILATYSGDEFLAIYRYFRSLAVDIPFLTARDNLIIAFEKNRQNYCQLVGDSKASSARAPAPRIAGRGRGKGEARLQSKDSKIETSSIKERAPGNPEPLKAFSVKFVRLNGILFTRTSLETFADVLSLAKNDFKALLSSGAEEQCSFGSDTNESALLIVRLVAILIFTVYNFNRESENQSYAEILQRSVLLQNAYIAVFEFMGHVIERCLQLQDPSSSYLLPAILVFVEWLACHPDVVTGTETEEIQSNARMFFWKNCISFFNKLLSCGLISEDEDETCFFNMSRYEEGESENRLALWEDFELRGFLPLHPAHQILDFSRKISFGNDGGNKEKRTRIQRIIAAGKAFDGFVRVGQEGIYFDSNSKKFIIGLEPQPTSNISLSAFPVPVVNGVFPELSVKNKENLNVLEAAPQMYANGDVEDEEEEIVFRPPSIADKHIDAMIPMFTSYQVLGSSDPIPASRDGFLLQNALNKNSKPLQLPIQPSTSNWLVDQQASIMNGFKKFSLVENGHSVNPKPLERSGTLQQAPVSVPFSHTVSFSYPAEVPSSVMPSKSSPTMSSINNFDLSAAKLMPIFPRGPRKGSTKPIRHIGPPPGFTPAPSKRVEDPFHSYASKDMTPLMDDYSWLDGYQTPLSAALTGFDGSNNLTGQAYSNISKGSSKTGVASFPFPGKQASAFQMPVVNHVLWQESQIPDHLKLFEEPKKTQVHQGNQQPAMSLPEQYQGHSLWEGRFLV